MTIITVILSYLLGSISFSYLAGKWLKGIDIRDHGSGNAGATNTQRVLGWKPAVTVLVLDIAKGVLAVWIGRWMAPDSTLLPVLGGLAVILGHNWPVFFRFKGGKGIASTIGVVASLFFTASLIAGILGILSIVITRYVSLGSLLFTLLLPLFVLLLDYPWEYAVAATLLFVFAWYRHRSNIMKLIRRQENKLGRRNTPAGGS